MLSEHKKEKRHLFAPKDGKVIADEHVWLVWAAKAGDIRLGAVCSSQEDADYYANDNLGVVYPGYKLFVEKVLLNHAFGANDTIQAMVLGKIGVVH